MTVNRHQPRVHGVDDAGADQQRRQGTLDHDANGVGDRGHGLRQSSGCASTRTVNE